jgi:hypothetical protein
MEISGWMRRLSVYNHPCKKRTSYITLSNLFDQLTPRSCPCRRGLNAPILTPQLLKASA